MYSCSFGLDHRYSYCACEGITILRCKSIAMGKSGLASCMWAILFSALFVQYPGSAVANVVVTGTFTIPLMKKTAYDSHFAAQLRQ